MRTGKGLGVIYKCQTIFDNSQAKTTHNTISLSKYNYADFRGS